MELGTQPQNIYLCVKKQKQNKRRNLFTLLSNFDANLLYYYLYVQANTLI